MKKRVKRLLVMLLTFCLILSQMTIPVMAASNNNNIYIFKPDVWCLYAEGYYIKKGEFTQDPYLYKLKNKNTNKPVAAYCADFGQPVVSTVNYRQLNLEDGYFGAEAAKQIRAILKNGYRFDPETNAENYGIINSNHNDRRNIAMVATQLAIWYCTDERNSVYCSFSDELENLVEYYAEMLYKLDPVEPSEQLFSDNYFIDSVDVKVDGTFNGSGVESYDVTVTGKIVGTVSTNAKDKLMMTATLGNSVEKLSETAGQIKPNSTFEFKFENLTLDEIDNETIELKVEGTQEVDDYYFYQAEGTGTAAQTNSQNMVGYYKGSTPVSASKTVSFVTLDGAKTVEGDGAPDKTFTFELKDSKGRVLDTQTAKAGESFMFAAQTYDKAGTYTYTISERNDGAHNWTYDGDKTVTVEVTEGDGIFVKKVTYPDGADKAVFTNKYSKPSETTAEIIGTKTVKGINNTTEEFTFVLVENGEEIATATREGKGTFKFDTITYTEARDHTYTVYEVDDGADNWEYDDSEFEVIVKVTEDTEGKLNADVKYVNGDIEFTNTYKPDVETPSDATPSDATSSNATAVIKGEKRVQGIGASNKLFTFILMEDGVEIDRATTMGAGFFKFDTLKFTEEGEHTYTVHELHGDAAGWTYDDTVYTVTIVVTKEGNKLVAEVEYEDGAIVFTNIYEEPEKPTVPGKKEDDDDDDTPKPTKSTEPETVPETVPETAPEAPSEVLGDEDIVGYDPNGVLGAYDQLPVGVLPATGDSALIWVLGMILSGLGLTGVNFKSKKRKNK